MKDRLLTAAAVAMTLVAVTVVGRRLLGPPVLPPLPDDLTPLTVEDWETYHEVGVALGQPNAPTSVTVFSDYLCVYCAELAPQLDDLLAEYPEGLRVRVRHYPTLGDVSVPAAIAAECADRAGAFDAMHSLIFAAVDESAGLSWTELAVQADVAEIGEFTRCAEDEASMARIEEDFEAATELGIYDTPTILLDSLLFTGSPGVRYLDAYIRRNARKEEGR